MKPVVIYFSCTGHTADAARRIARILDSPVMQLEPEQPYTEADLDWENDTSRVCVEHRTPGARPALKPLHTDLDNFDTVFLGFPIWWDKEPPIICTFLESCDLRDKTIFPFATSVESPITEADIDLNRRYDGLIWMNGLRMPASDSEITRWINQKD